MGGYVLYLCKKTLEKLRNIINGDSTDDYKSGPMLVAFLMNLALIIFMVKDFQLEGFLQMINWIRLMGYLNWMNV